MCRPSFLATGLHTVIRDEFRSQKLFLNGSSVELLIRKSEHFNSGRAWPGLALVWSLGDREGPRLEAVQQDGPVRAGGISRAVLFEHVVQFQSSHGPGTGVMILAFQDEHRGNISTKVGAG